MIDIDVTKVDAIRVNLLVDIIEKGKTDEDAYVRGYVKEILSKKDCEKGVRVRLTNGSIGHIREVPSADELKKENFKFYNLFFYEKVLYGFYDKSKNELYIITKLNKQTELPERIVLLFSSKEIAAKYLKEKFSDNKNLLVRPIKRSKPIIELFQKYKVNTFILNAKRKLNNMQMRELEEYYKSF